MKCLSKFMLDLLVILKFDKIFYYLDIFLVSKYKKLGIYFYFSSNTTLKLQSIGKVVFKIFQTLNTTLKFNVRIK